MGLRVVRDDGGPIRFRQALVRGLAGVFLEKLGITYGLLALILIVAGASKKRLGDHLAGTIVLQERVPGTHRCTNRDASAARRMGCLAGPVGYRRRARVADAPVPYSGRRAQPGGTDGPRAADRERSRGQSRDAAAAHTWLGDPRGGPRRAPSPSVRDDATRVAIRRGSQQYATQPQPYATSDLPPPPTPDGFAPPA